LSTVSNLSNPKTDLIYFWLAQLSIWNTVDLTRLYDILTNKKYFAHPLEMVKPYFLSSSQHKKIQSNQTCPNITVRQKIRIGVIVALFIPLLTVGIDEAHSSCDITPQCPCSISFDLSEYSGNYIINATLVEQNLGSYGFVIDEVLHGYGPTLTVGDRIVGRSLGERLCSDEEINLIQGTQYYIVYRVKKEVGVCDDYQQCVQRNCGPPPIETNDDELNENLLMLWNQCHTDCTLETQDACEVNQDTGALDEKIIILSQVGSVVDLGSDYTLDVDALDLIIDPGKCDERWPSPAIEDCDDTTPNSRYDNNICSLSSISALPINRYKMDLFMFFTLFFTLWLNVQKKRDS